MPYIDVGPFSLLGLKIHMFGILVACGVVVGSWIGAAYAEKNEIDVDWLRWAAFRIVIVGFVGAHVVDVVFYQPDKLAKDPLLLIKVWNGISSYGGFIGAIAGFYWFVRPKYGPPVSKTELGDCFVFGFAPGFWFGRMACTTAHDHAGRATEFMFGVHYPEGAHKLAGGVAGTYHDLGLYEAMFLMPAIVLGLVLLYMWKGRRPGMLIAWFAIAYAVPRFFLDYLRFPESDPRYLGLTPAQYFSVALLAGGIYCLVAVVAKQPKTTLALARERAEEAKAAAKAAAKESAKAKKEEEEAPAKKSVPASKKAKQPASKSRKK